jgi:hypothetical protein
MPTTSRVSQGTTTEVSAYRRERHEAEYSYHLDRMTSKFSLAISPENAELLAGLLADERDDQLDVV